METFQNKSRMPSGIRLAGRSECRFGMVPGRLYEAGQQSESTSPNSLEGSVDFAVG
jgi:hypothetical protein